MCRMHRHAVAHDVQIGSLEINNFLAAGILDLRIADVPFARNHPIEYGSTTRYFLNVERDLRPYFHVTSL